MGFIDIIRRRHERHVGGLTTSGDAMVLGGGWWVEQRGSNEARPPKMLDVWIATIDVLERFGLRAWSAFD